MSAKKNVSSHSRVMSFWLVMWFFNQSQFAKWFDYQWLNVLQGLVLAIFLYKSIQLRNHIIWKNCHEVGAGTVFRCVQTLSYMKVNVLCLLITE